MIRKPQMLFKLGGLTTDTLSVLLVLLFFATLDLPGTFIALALFTTLLTMSLLGMYQLERSEKLFDTLFRTGFSSAVGFLVSLSLISISINPDVILRITILMTLIMTTARLILSEFERMYYETGEGRVPILIIGMSKAGESFLQKVHSNNDLTRINILGFLDNSIKEPIFETPWLGKLVDIENVIQKLKPEAIIQVGLLEQMVTITAVCQQYNLEYHVLPSLIGAFGKKVSVSTDAGIPLINVKETNLHGWGFVWKRLFDIAAAILLIVISIPVILFTSIALVIERKSFNILVSEKRIDGRTGNIFSMFRFITLKDGIEEDPLNSDELRLHSEGQIADKSLDDATRLGAFLRRLEINEIPQLFNVLRNEMSIVGPRAPFPSEIEHYTNFHQKRLRLKPGLTGMWQVTKHQTDGTHDALLKTDIYYVENWSLTLDVKILAKTGVYVFKKMIS